MCFLFDEKDLIMDSKPRYARTYNRSIDAYEIQPLEYCAQLVWHVKGPSCDSNY